MSTAENLGPQFDEPQHDVLYHLTDKAKFKPKANVVPHDNTIAINERTSPGLYLTDDPNRWFTGHGYARPFVAEMHVPKGLAHDQRWGGEKFLPAEHIAKATVHRVIPIDAKVREDYGSHGHIEEHHGTEFDTGKPIKQPGWNAPLSEHYPLKGYKYDGPDVRDMPGDQIREHKRRARAYQNRPAQ